MPLFNTPPSFKILDEGVQFIDSRRRCPNLPLFPMEGLPEQWQKCQSSLLHFCVSAPSRELCTQGRLSFNLTQFCGTKQTDFKMGYSWKENVFCPDTEIYQGQRPFKTYLSYLPECCFWRYYCRCRDRVGHHNWHWIAQATPAGIQGERKSV